MACFFGLLVGIKADIPVGEDWQLSPFALFGDTFGSQAFFNPFGNSGECRGFNVSSVTTGSASNIPDGDEECGGGSSQEYLYDTQVGGLGLNLHYKPWELSVNLFAPLINRYILGAYYDYVDPDFFYLSLTWQWNIEYQNTNEQSDTTFQ